MRLSRLSVSWSSASLRVPDGSDHFRSIPRASSLVVNSTVQLFFVIAVRS